MKNRKLIAVLSLLAFVLITSVLLLTPRNSPPQNKATEKTVANSKASRQEQPNDENENPLFAAVTDPQKTETATLTWAESMLQIILRLMVAVILSGILAFRPRKDVPLFRRSLFVSQTQILLAVVAAALMMVVGDSAARAFAIFAAASLVRFRTNIRDPKEITVLLISLALGLAAGVGRWELGIALCLFALGLLWILEYNESQQVVRAMELTVKTKDVDTSQEILKKIFRRIKIDAEVRAIDPPDEKNPVGSIVYYMNLRLNLTTDYLSDQILAADPNNIEGLQWSKSKAATDIYQ